jgi:hypothetical protein
LVKLVGLIWTDVIMYVVHDPYHPWRIRIRQLWPGK